MTATWLRNDHVELGFVPELGGRLLSLRFAGRELLWRNDSLVDAELEPVGGHVFAPNSGTMGDWVNYGGDKTWLAPQALDEGDGGGDDGWAGPPDPVLDSGPYTVDVRDGSVLMSSGTDPRTGVRLTRAVTIEPGRAGYRLELLASNLSDRPVRWALWNVTQFPGGGEVIVSLRDEVRPPVVNLVAGTGNPRYTVEGNRLRVPSQRVVGKLGVPAAAGDLAYVRDGVEVLMSFPVRRVCEYPDRGSPVEVWLEHPLRRGLAHLGGLRPRAHVVECEVLGPLTRIAPGATTSLGIDVLLRNKELVA